MPRKQRSRLRVSEHAVERWQERGGRRKLRPGRAQRTLMGLLQRGVRPDKDLRVEIPLEDGIVGYAVPAADGGWVLTTVVRMDEEVSA